MTRISLQQLSTAELRKECMARGISMSCSKPDVIIRLEDHIRERGQDPDQVLSRAAVNQHIVGRYGRAAGRFLRGRHGRELGTGSHPRIILLAIAQGSRSRVRLVGAEIKNWRILLDLNSESDH